MTPDSQKNIIFRSEDLKNCVVPGYFSFVIYRNWTQPDGIKPYPEAVRDVSPSEQVQSALHPIPENNVAGTSSKKDGKGSDSGYDSHVTNSSGGNSRTQSVSTDNGYDLEQRRSSVCYQPTKKTDIVHVQKNKTLTWIGGSCAVIQFKKSETMFKKIESSGAFQTAFHFTAVRNPEFAEKLLKLRK